MSKKRYVKKEIAQLLSEDKEVRQSYLNYRINLNALPQPQKDKENQETLWNTASDKTRVHDLRNALICFADPNEQREGFTPLHLMLKSKNKEGLKVLFRYTQVDIIVDRLALTYAQKWHPRIARMLFRYQHNRNPVQRPKIISKKRQLPLNKPNIFENN